MLRTTIVLSVFLFSTQYITAQSVTGSWYGRADVVAQGVNNNYLTELVLKQKGNEVEGVFGYYFKDIYQSFFIRGTYNKKTREVTIKNLPLIFYRSASTKNGIECPMNFEGILRINKVRSILSGSFYSDEKYKYTCPQLRVNFSLDQEEKNQDSILHAAVAAKKFWQPQREDFIVTSVANNKPVTISAGATAEKNAAVKEEPVNSLQSRFEQRKNIYMETLEIEGDSVRISFYDNGDIDGDSISILLNKQPVLEMQELSARALNIYLVLDNHKDIHEVSMFAENLGIYPPNTALMVVIDGVKRHEVYLSSTLTQTATVRLKKKKK